MATLITRTGSESAEQASRRSRHALDRPLEADAELSVAQITTPAVVVGAFQRHHVPPSDHARVRRVSGGPFVTVGPGTIHVLLALGHPGALVPCDPRRLVNRYVRPLLRALTKAGALTHYFGRDWLSSGHHPVGEVTFAHDSTTRRAVFEAFIAVGCPFAPAGRASFLGKAPRTLDGVMGRALEKSAIQELVVRAYSAEADAVLARDFEAAAPEPEPWDDPPWVARVDEAIGEVAAGNDRAGRLTLGGDLLASRDAVERVGARVAARCRAADVDAIGAIVDEELSPPHVALDGVRDLASVRDVLARALGAV